MVDFTDNHAYQLFADDELPWEHRSDMESLDTDVEIRDTDANRSNYTPKDGAKYVATDTGTVYLGDGSSWTKLGEIVPEVVTSPDISRIFVRDTDPANDGYDITSEDLWLDTSQ